MTTGERIRELRKKLGLTQEELGKMIGVQKAAINKYETGIVVNLKQSVIHGLAKALQVSPVVLLNGDDELTGEERRLLDLYRSATDGGKRNAFVILEANQKKDTERMVT